ncbi:MAG: hypothetical protein MJE68_03300 [Proteobacteria bacterium]|nr:hypothetical protein [Pseudomonadota bacterium]
MTFDLCLVVDPLDGEEDLPQRLRLNDVMHKLNCQPLTVVYHMSLQSNTKITSADKSLKQSSRVYSTVLLLKNLPLETPL